MYLTLRRQEVHEINNKRVKLLKEMLKRKTVGWEEKYPPEYCIRKQGCTTALTVAHAEKMISTWVTSPFSRPQDNPESLHNDSKASRRIKTDRAHQQTDMINRKYYQCSTTPTKSTTLNCCVSNKSRPRTMCLT